MHLHIKIDEQFATHKAIITDSDQHNALYTEVLNALKTDNLEIEYLDQRYVINHVNMWRNGNSHHHMTIVMWNKTTFDAMTTDI